MTLGDLPLLEAARAFWNTRGARARARPLADFRHVDDRHGGRLRVVVLGVEAAMEVELEVEGDSPWRVQGSEYVCLIVSCRCWRWAFYPVSIATSGNRD